MAEDEIIRYHQLNRHEFEQSLKDSEGQGSLACCSPRGCKESDMTEQLNTLVLAVVLLYKSLLIVTLVICAVTHLVDTFFLK